MDFFRRVLLITSFLLSQSKVWGEFPLTLILSPTLPQDVRTQAEIFLLCVSNSNNSLGRLETTLTINGQNIGGFSRGAFLNESALQFRNFVLNADTDQRVAQCHFGNNHSDPYVIDIVNVDSEFPISLTASTETLVENDPLTITCNVTNGATGMVVLRINSDPIMNSTITDPTQSVITFVIDGVSRYDGADCFMAQCTLGEDGSDPLVITVTPICDACMENRMFYCTAMGCDNFCAPRPGCDPSPSCITNETICTECIGACRDDEYYCLSSSSCVSLCDTTVECQFPCPGQANEEQICRACTCQSDQYFCLSSSRCVSPCDDVQCPVSCDINGNSICKMNQLSTKAIGGISGGVCGGFLALILIIIIVIMLCMECWKWECWNKCCKCCKDDQPKAQSDLPNELDEKPPV